MYGKNVVEIIERALKTKKISKGEFYKATGISSATFSQWRLGQNDPSSEKLRKAEDFLGISFEYKETDGETVKPESSSVSEDYIKYALFGDADVTDELFEEVKRYAKYAQEQERFRKFKKG